MKRVLIAAALLSASPMAWAQAPAAEALFEQGRAALVAGDLETACARFRASDQIDPAPGTKANLADCEERRGRVATAWELNRAALARLPQGDSRIAILKQRIAKLEPRLPKLMLSLAPAAPKDTTVREGGTLIGGVGTYGVPLPLDPGVRHLVVTADGHAPRSIDVTLVEGTTETIEVEPGSATITAPPTPSTPEAATSVPSRASPGPWIVGGVGLVALAFGGVTGAIVLQRRSVTNAHCTDGPPPTCKDQAGLDAASVVRTLGPVSTVGFVLGAAGLVAGGIWLGVQRGGKSSARFGVGPVVGGVAWRVEGSW